MHVLSHEHAGIHVPPVELVGGIEGHELDIPSSQLSHPVCCPHGALQPTGVLVLQIPRGSCGIMARSGADTYEERSGWYQADCSMKVMGGEGGGVMPLQNTYLKYPPPVSLMWIPA